MKPKELKKHTDFPIPELLQDSFIFVLDKQYRFVDYRTTKPNLPYVCPDFFLGKRVHEIFPKVVSEKITESLKTTSQKKFHTGTVISLELEKKIFWFELSILQENDIHSGKERFIVYSRDVTARIKTEQALKEKEKQYSFLEQNITDVIIEHDSNGKYLYVSASVKDLLGYHPDELIGKDPEDFLHPDDYQIFKKLFCQQNKNRTLVRTVYRRRKKDDSYIWVENLSNVYLNQNSNQIDRVISVIRNVDDRKRAEHKIELNNCRMKSLLDIWRVPSGNMELLFDKALETALELTLSKVGYIYYYDEDSEKFTLYSWSDTAMKECKIDAKKAVYDLETTGIWGDVVRNRKPLIINDFQKKNKRKKGYPSGHIKLSRFLSVPVTNDNKIVAVIGVGNKQDPYDREDVNQLLMLSEMVWHIHKQKEYEDNLTQLTSKLEDLIEHKNRFISILAHDLRNPFNSLLGFSDLMIRNLNNYDKNKIRSQLIMMNRTIRNAFNLLTDLLLWSRSKNEESPFEPIAISLSEVCSEILQNHQDLLVKKQITSKYIEKEPLKIKADIGMFKTILRNLISNAYKFTRNEGYIAVYAEKIDNYAKITVSDNGIGITESDISKIWCTSEKYSTQGILGEKGTGFGLKICKDFIDRHGGKIWVESKKEIGSNFIFTMPLETAN